MGGAIVLLIGVGFFIAFPLWIYFKIFAAPVRDDIAKVTGQKIDRRTARALRRNLELSNQVKVQQLRLLQGQNYNNQRFTYDQKGRQVGNTSWAEREARDRLFGGDED